jgi:hypothetical protein
MIARSERGHEDQFGPLSLNGGCRFSEATFAGMGGKEKDAPMGGSLPRAAPEPN